MPTKLSKSEAIERLRLGNARWVASVGSGERRTSERRAETASTQNPFASVLACADSRVSPALVFDEGVGDLFVVRTAGQVVDTAVLSSLVFGVSVLKTPVVVVMGHTDCGAVAAVRSGSDYGPDLEGVTSAISKEVVSAETVDIALRLHVQDTVTKLTPKLGATVVGAIYDTATGQVSFL